MTEETGKITYSNGKRTIIDVSIQLNPSKIKDISRRKKKSCKKRKGTTRDVSIQMRPSLISDHISSSKSRRRSVEELPPVCKGEEGMSNIELEEEENVTEDQDKTETNDVELLDVGMADAMVNEEIQESVFAILVDVDTEENIAESIEDVTEMTQNVTSVQVENVCSYMDEVSTKKEDQSLSVSPEDPVLTVDDPDQANKPFHHLTQFLMDPVPPVSSLNISDLQTISRTIAKITEFQSQLVEKLFQDKA